MTFAQVGTLGAKPGKRDELVGHLTQNAGSHELRDAGCLLYEVGISDDDPDKVFVVELWESAEAHHSSLKLESVRTSIAAAMPLLSGDNDGFRFDVIGSPLRD